MDLTKIKATIVLPKNAQDKEYDQWEMLHVPGAWGGSTIKVLWSQIIAEPVLAIKRDSRLSSKTNATLEEVNFIIKTPLVELQKLLKSDGKNTRSRRGNERETVSGDEESKK